jgi:sterol desaturase/sphingolipid hydroxylase (fatty acid hydroxylase superfamily)
MLSSFSDFVGNTAQSVWLAFQVLFVSGFIFCSIAMLFKGDEAVAAGRRAVTQFRINLSIYFFDVLFIAPLVGLLVQVIRLTVDHQQLRLIPTAVWSSQHQAVTFVAVIFIGDFCSYWRHRLEHTRLLWPSHAIHHSDPQMSWLTLARFHPVNRFTTAALDILWLALLGFPDWALVANELVRHYYGEFIHADLPWTYGPFGRIFVSPVMHQWHHARDVVGAGSNFATVFSVFDQAFRTHHVPGLCTVPLGVVDDMGDGVTGQLLYPLRVWRGQITGLWHRSQSPELPKPQP